jgi:hypothetical protein
MFAVYNARKKNQCHTILELFARPPPQSPRPPNHKLCLRRRAAEPAWRGSGAAAKQEYEISLALGLGFSPIRLFDRHGA